MVTRSARLTGVVERMDLPGVEPGELRRTLADLAGINRRFGGAQLLLTHLSPWLTSLPGPIRLLDAATGFGDLARTVVAWARRAGIRLAVEAVDHHPEICAIAREASRDYPEIAVREADALALPYPDQSFDVAVASQVLHHMEGEQPVRLLTELRRVARHGVLVSDLRRGAWPYLVTTAALHLVSRSPLIRHDGPLSIRRGFVPPELTALARAAGWRSPRVVRHAFFRLALVDDGPARGRSN